MRTVSFGSFELDDHTFTLSRDGEPVSLSPRPARVLWVLASRAGELVTRDEIGEIVWPRGGVELDQALNTYIRQIRTVLDDDARSPRFIRTHPRRGYQFIAEVEEVVPSLQPSTLPPARTRPRPRALLAIAAIAALFGVVGVRTLTSDESVRIAVIPFENLTGDQAQDFIVHGLTEEVIAGLISRSPTNATVFSKASTERLWGDEGSDLVGASELLGATHVVEGSLKGGVSGVRVTASLVRVSDGASLWMEQYDRSLGDVLGLQIEIAGRIIESVSRSFALDEELTNPDAIAPEARLALARADYLLNQKTPETVARSIEEFRLALSLDDGIAAAHAGLGYALAISGDPQAAESEIETAIGLDPSLAKSYWVRGEMRWALESDWAASVSDLQRAVALDPNNAEARHSLAIKEAMLGRTESALQGMAQVVRVNPLSPAVHSDYALAYLWAGEFDLASKQCAEMARIAPRVERWRAARCDFVVATSRVDEVGATDAARRWLELLPDGGARPADPFLEGPSPELDDFLRWRKVAALARPELRLDEGSEVWSTLRTEGTAAAMAQVEEMVSQGRASVLTVRVDPRLRELRGTPALRASLSALSRPGVRPEPKADASLPPS